MIVLVLDEVFLVNPEGGDWVEYLLMVNFRSDGGYLYIVK